MDTGKTPSRCFYEIHKKILFLDLVKRFISNRVNQQENFQEVSSETVCKISFQLEAFASNLPEHRRNWMDKHFLEWFIGFVEGDGSFIISPKKNKVYFDLTQSLVDIKVLNMIRTQLGFGKILKREEKERSVGVFYVTGKDNFLRLINLFNGNLVSEYKKEQLKKWLEVFNRQYDENIPYIERELNPSLSTAWLSGFIDAEGCFVARTKAARSGKLGKQVLTDFSISQKHKEILIRIRTLFINKNTNLRFDSSWEGYQFYLSNKKILKILVRYLNQFPLRTIKKVKYLHWSKIHSICLNKQLSS